jgi:hypothetical protein
MTNPVYLFLHIPRTGGTFIEHAVGHWSDREKDRYLQQYNYVQNWSEKAYENHKIPNLIYRTTEQQRQIKIMTGHSIFCNSHRWLRIQREPRIFSTIRHPVERCLSSFNYRHSLATLTQDPSSFALSTPFMNENACHQRKVASDYDTLWEYYQDSTFESNIQCKWLIKSFLHRENDTWQRHPVYVFGPDAGIPAEQAVPLTWPQWMFYPPIEEKEIDWYKLAENFFPEIWWLTRTEMLNTSIKDFCNYAGLEFMNTGIKNESIKQYWTLDDVKKQPDIQKLIDAEMYDYQLYETAKQWKRPF